MSAYFDTTVYRPEVVVVRARPPGTPRSISITAGTAGVP